MFRAQLAAARAEAEALAEDVEHLRDLVRVSPLAAHPRAEIAHVQLSSAHFADRAQNPLQFFGEKFSFSHSEKTSFTP